MPRAADLQQPPPATADEWKERKVILVWLKPRNGLPPKQVDRSVVACVYGQLAVHASFGQADRWAVSAIITGLQITNVTTCEEAMRVAETLWNNPQCRAALRHDQSEVVLAALPPWVEHWAKACRETGVWVNPTPYQSQARK